MFKIISSIELRINFKEDFYFYVCAQLQNKVSLISISVEKYNDIHTYNKILTLKIYLKIWKTNK